jgi:SOS-response transcriptional repressor LexA
MSTEKREVIEIKGKPGTGKSKNLGARIRAARKLCGLNQTDFGKRLGVSQAAISNWESDTDEPNPLAVSRLAEVMNNPDLVVEFLDASGIGNLLVAECKSYSSSETRANEVREIVLLRDPSAAGTSRVLDSTEAETILRLPKTWFPPQGEIYALRIDDDSMAPVISDGSLVFVDTSKRNPETLLDKLVAVRVNDKVTVRSVQKRGQSLFISHKAADAELVETFVRVFKQTIIGEVVMWISRPQPSSAARLAHFRNEIEEYVALLLKEKGFDVKGPFSNGVAKLTKSKQLDPTLERLILSVVEIGDRVEHELEIAASDIEKANQFMPIIRSRLNELIQALP